MRKSELYKDYRFSFKFVNSDLVQGPIYFKYDYYDNGLRVLREVPPGGVETDLGNIENDFYFESGLGDCGLSNGITDGGLAKGCRIHIDLEEGIEPVQGVCVTHETGLEVFLVSAAAFVGAGVAKYTLSHVIEFIHARINKWFKRVFKNSSSTSGSIVPPVVDHIEVRTPHWTISLDGRFDSSERREILDYISENLIPEKDVAKYLNKLDDKELQAKASKISRRVRKKDLS